MYLAVLEEVVNVSFLRSFAVECRSFDRPPIDPLHPFFVVVGARFADRGFFCSSVVLREAISLRFALCDFWTVLIHLVIRKAKICSGISELGCFMGMRCKADRFVCLFM